MQIMNKRKLVASLSLLVGLFSGCLPAHDDGGDPSPRYDGISQPVSTFTEKNGSRLKAVSGWKCGDGSQSVTGTFYDTHTNAPCGISWLPSGSFDRGPWYCTPNTRAADPAQDQACSRVVNP